MMYAEKINTYREDYGKVVPFRIPEPSYNPEPAAQTPTFTYDDIKARHDAEPFKTKEEIETILTYFLDKHIASWNTAQRQPSRKWNPRYLRNYLLFQIGFNCGLRASDLTKLQIGHFIDANGRYRSETEILEQKTSKYRDTRTVYINQQIIDAIELYKQYHQNYQRSDYLFPTGYDTNNNPIQEHLTRRGLDDIIRTVTKECNLNQTRCGTHAIRKTFAYHALQQLGNNDRGVKVLQKMLGHKELDSTLHYTGITQDEIKNTCMGLEIGFTKEELIQKGM